MKIHKPQRSTTARAMLMKMRRIEQLQRGASKSSYYHPAPYQDRETGLSFKTPGKPYISPSRQHYRTTIKALKEEVYG